MKKVFLLLFIFSSLLFSWSKVKIEVNGMSCPMSVDDILLSMNDRFPDYNISLKYKEKILELESNQSREINATEIKNMLENQGYLPRILK